LSQIETCFHWYRYPNLGL